MRKAIKSIILLIVILLLSYMGNSIYKSIIEKEAVAIRIRNLPTFGFKDLYGYTFKNTDLNRSQSCLLIYFHPDCEHCQYEASLFIPNMRELAPYQILMISSDLIQNIKKFEEKYHLNEMDNIVMLHDSNYDFEKIFGTKIIPTSFIYDKNQKLKKIFKGEVKIEAVLKNLEDESTEETK